MGPKQAAALNVVQIACDYLTSEAFWQIMDDSDNEKKINNKAILNDSALESNLYVIMEASKTKLWGRALHEKLNQFIDTSCQINYCLAHFINTTLILQLHEWKLKIQSFDALETELEVRQHARKFSLYFDSLLREIMQAQLVFFANHEENLRDLEGSLACYGYNIFLLTNGNTALSMLRTDIQSKQLAYKSEMQLMEEYGLVLSSELEGALDAFDQAMEVQPQEMTDRLFGDFGNIQLNCSMEMADSVAASVAAAEKVIGVAKNYLMQEEFLSTLSDIDQNIIIHNINLDNAVNDVLVVMSSEEQAQELKDFLAIKDHLNDQLKLNAGSRFFSNLQDLAKKIEFLKLNDNKVTLNVLRSFNTYFLLLPHQLQEAYTEIFQDHVDNLSFLQDALEPLSKEHKSDLLELIQTQKNAYANKITMLKQHEFRLSPTLDTALNKFNQAVDIHPEVYADQDFSVEDTLSEISSIASSELDDVPWERGFSASPHAPLYGLRRVVSESEVLPDVLDNRRTQRLYDSL